MAYHPEAFGKYYLVDKIAVGGMAEIFKAKQFGPGGFEKVLVIKRILSHLSEDEDFIGMFHDEAMISSKLSHSNIVHVYEFGKIRNNYFIAMEYCEGKDLKTAMKKCQMLGRPMPLEYAVYIVHEVCRGLDYAHRKKDENDKEMNILHRDISPSNVMLSYDEGEVKIADFGIAKAQDASYQTKAGVLKGKFEYMSPEQALGLPVDRRSDIYACGIVFYEILTRRRLFKTDSDVKTLELIRNPLIPPPSHLNPHVGPELDAVVMKALARDPEERYQEAWQMQHDLREFMRAAMPPTSPDLIALSLANFLREIFAREIRKERERLEIGTRVARELMVTRGERTDEIDLEENWDIPSGGGGELGTTELGATAVRLMIDDKKRSSGTNPLLVGVGVAALVVVIGVLLFGGLRDDSLATHRESPRVLNTDEAATARDNPGPPHTQERVTLQIDAKQAGARVFINGRQVGRTPLVRKDLLTPGDVVDLEVELRGYRPHAERLEVGRDGEPIKLSFDLEPVGSQRRPGEPRPKPPPKEQKPLEVKSPPAPPPAPGKLEFTSDPAGASVLVNGKKLCETPCWMDKGRADATYLVELRMEGYGTENIRARFPQPGESRLVDATLKPIEVGILSVSIKDRLSAEIFVDGVQKGHSSPGYSIEVPAGRHEIRLRNQIAGLETTFQVEIEAGKETKKLNVDLQGP